MRLAANPRLLVVTAALRMTLFPIPVITLFWTEQIGITLADAMQLQAIFGLAVVVCEFPSGYLADRIGYRRSQILGYALAVAGWVAYAEGTTFAGIALAEILLGAGAAFVSGADAALLYESLAEGDAQTDYPRWEGRVRAASQLAEAGSSAAGGWLYALAPRLPFWLQLPVACGALAASAALAESPRPPHGERVSHVVRAVAIVRHSLLHHRRLRTAMALSVVLGQASFLMVWLIQPWMQRRGIPTPWFGPIWAAAHLWLAGVSLASARVVAHLGRRGTLLVCCALIAGSYAALATITVPIGVVAYLGLMTVRGLQGPILTTVMQADAPPADRASVLSLNSLLFRLAFVAIGPPAGALVDHIGLESALAVIGTLTTLLACLAWRAFAAAHDDAAGQIRPSAPFSITPSVHR